MKQPMLLDEELYECFSKTEIAAIAKEVGETYDPDVVAESNRNVRSFSKERWVEVKKEGEDIAKALASVMSTDPSSREAQKLIAKHFAHIDNFYKPTIEMYRGLGNLYATDHRFRAYYDKYAKDLADFIDKAIGIYCDNGLTVLNLLETATNEDSANSLINPIA